MDEFWNVSSFLRCPGASVINASLITSSALGAVVAENGTHEWRDVFEACNCSTWNSDTQDVRYIKPFLTVTWFAHL